MSPPRVGVVNSNIGNLTSAVNALSSLGGQVEIVTDPDKLKGYSHVVLPGVGSFAKGMEQLQATGMDKAVVEAAQAGCPLLGLCLGMQLLADEGHEFGLTKGLGLIPGSVVRLASNSPGCRLPHIGWNDVTPVQSSPLFEKMPDKPATFYFIHSYGYSDPAAAAVTALTDHGGPVVAAVENGNISGVQFHPEKSQRCGLALLRNFLSLC